jgi:hypothetical protein
MRAGVRWRWSSLALGCALFASDGNAEPSCRALYVDGHPIVEIDADDALGCRRLAKEAVKRLCCDPEVERFRFLIQYGGERPTSAEVFCEKENHR